MKTTRQHTRVIVQIHSHVKEVGTGKTGEGRLIDVSSDVVFVQTSKNTKKRGKFQIKLVPRRNYLNFIFPNDVVNIYIDPGDGKRGFVRTLMGYVDRIDRTEVTDSNGAVNTTFVIMGSDFQKAMDTTSIYFNNHMRQILAERFSKTDQGKARGRQRNDADGSALRNAGVIAHGTPADFVENFLLTLLGFGQQWQLPSVYTKNSDQIKGLRKDRVQRAIDRIPNNTHAHLQTLGVDVEATIESIIAILEEIPKHISTPTEARIGWAAIQRSAAQQLEQSGILTTLRALIFQLDASNPIGILDLLSFDLIEALAVDGYNQAAIVWQHQGSLSQFLYGHCNEFVNELIFDLRPVSNEEGISEGAYSCEADELGINAGGTEKFSSPVRAVKYVPSVVFREYPYSVINKFDLDRITFVPKGADSASQTFPGEVYFGPIFSKNPGVAGRHTYTYPEPISPVSCRYLFTHKPTKHIDVVVINSIDVVSSSLGRSDDDVLNVFQLTAKSGRDMSIQYRSVLSNFSPIINQASVAKNGLRRWEQGTIFANYGRSFDCAGSGVDSAATRYNLVRWQMLLDHWYQHNAEYLSGVINLRGMPELRVGYRLDWKERNESYYVESVSHSWKYPGALKTTVQVTRGQRNDPFPVYIPPVFIGQDDESLVNVSGDRSLAGRLGQFFKVRDTPATTNSTQKKEPFSTAENTTDQDGTNLSLLGGVVVFPDTGQRTSDTIVFDIDNGEEDPPLQ